MRAKCLVGLLIDRAFRPPSLCRGCSASCRFWVGFHCRGCLASRRLGVMLGVPIGIGVQGAETFSVAFWPALSVVIACPSFRFAYTRTTNIFFVSLRAYRSHPVWLGPACWRAVRPLSSPSVAKSVAFRPPPLCRRCFASLLDSGSGPRDLCRQVLRISAAPGVAGALHRVDVGSGVTYM